MFFNNYWIYNKSQWPSGLIGIPTDYLTTHISGMDGDIPQKNI